MKTVFLTASVTVLSGIFFGAFVWFVLSVNPSEGPPSSVHRMGATAPANGAPNFNGEVITGGLCLDTEPQPLAYVDASLSDGGTQDGGWYAPSGKIPKGFFLNCSGTTANVVVDMLGYGGKAGQTNVTLTGVACGVVQPYAISKVYQSGTTATTVQICY